MFKKGKVMLEVDGVDETVEDQWGWGEGSGGLGVVKNVGVVDRVVLEGFDIGLGLGRVRMELVGCEFILGLD